MENFDFYISANGYLVIPEYNIRYLIDFTESNIPSMPEAVEATARIAGRDGDIVLKTTYEPLPFEIVCYTDDGLTQEEKTQEEDKVKAFLETIKNKTKTFAMEKYNKFYDVKYNAALVTTEYPAHMKFAIPFKSSESYAKNLTESSIIGNGDKTSNTIKEVGAIFTIEGPAQTPKISLNDYIMSYDNSLLESHILEINSKNSTITHINTTTGIRTNAMRDYNHEFPKIQKGKNSLKVLSGIDDETKVKVKWYDLKL